MLLTIASWVMILIIITSLGTIISYLIEKMLEYEIKKISSILMIGVVLAAVYAEFFSLFYKVGVIAVILLVCLCALGLLFCRSYTAEWFGRIKTSYRRHKIHFLCMILIFICVLILGSFDSSKYPGGYDTENYHAPAIRWTEEYGVVKGLGNLHSRFAYNSSFLCLQALFSFTYIFGQSMHSMNGFLWVFMAAYTIFGLCLFHDRRFQLSDFLRIIFLNILFAEINGISSPNTDFMPLCLAAYIFIEWTDQTELGQVDSVPYALLSILGLFAASTKLSAGVLFVFAIKPFFDYLKKKQFRSIILFSFIGVFAITPFLARNLIISGYLLYPVHQTDFLSDIFKFDWTMPKSVTVSDNVMIKAFARGWGSNYGYDDIDRSFFQWFSIWIEKSSSYYVVYGIINLILSIILLPFTIFKMFRNRCFRNSDMILLMSAVCFLFLLFSAPAVRFGKWYFWSLPIIVIYHLFVPDCGRSQDNSELYRTYNSMLVTGFFIIALLSVWISNCCKANLSELLVRPINYSKAGETSPYEVMNDTKIFYYFREGKTFSLNSYFGFPGTECYKTLKRIEMRGENLSDGFKPKDEYRNIAYDFQGRILSADNILSLKINGVYDIDFMINYRDPY